MADEKLTKPPVIVHDSDVKLPAAEIRREMAVLRSASAPVLYFDAYSTSGAYGGIANITLICGLHTVVDGQNVNERRDVAHLRFPLTTVALLRQALDQIELLAQPPASNEKN